MFNFEFLQCVLEFLQAFLNKFYEKVIDDKIPTGKLLVNKLDTKILIFRKYLPISKMCN